MVDGCQWRAKLISAIERTWVQRVIGTVRGRGAQRGAVMGAVRWSDTVRDITLAGQWHKIKITGRKHT